MSQDALSQSETSSPFKQSGETGRKQRVYLVSYPKIVFLYPTFLAAIAAGTYMAFTAEPAGTTAYLVTLAFLLVLALNLVVLSFDFPRTTSLTLFFFCVAVGIGLWSLFRGYPDLVPPITNFFRGLTPVANAQFYFIFAGLLAIIYAGVLVSVQFDYWEVRPNELLHHHGILSNLKRLHAPKMRIDKEINDLFEYALLRSGRLILHPSNEPRAIVLENVLFINHKEREITRMLGALQVQVRSSDAHH